MQAAKIGGKTADIEKAAEAVVKPGLLKLGLITDATGEQFRTWYTHGICHWIGMDVHDVGDYQKPLAAGMAFTIEPGIYVRPAQGVPEQFHNIGIRIEDDAIVTETGCELISRGVPVSATDIEALMRN